MRIWETVCGVVTTYTSSLVTNIGSKRFQVTYFPMGIPQRLINVNQKNESKRLDPEQSDPKKLVPLLNPYALYIRTAGGLRSADNCKLIKKLASRMHNST